MDKKEAFRRALSHMINKQGWGAQTKLSKAINISQQMISMILSGDAKGSEETRDNVAEYYGFKYEEFLKFGEKLIAVDADETFELSAKVGADHIQEDKSAKAIEVEHADLIKGFKNKALAKIIDEQLLNLEKLDPAALHKVQAYIEGMINVYQSPFIERRKSDQPEKIPISGDRRKAVG